MQKLKVAKQAVQRHAKGVLVVDVSDPSNPEGLGRLSDGRSTLSVSIADGIAFVAQGFEGLRIFDARAELELPGRVTHPRWVDYTQAVRVFQGTVYVAARGEVRLFELGGPAAPED